MRSGIWRIGVAAVLLTGGCASSTVHIGEKSRVVIERKEAAPGGAVPEPQSERLTPPRKDQPMHITSDRMAYQEQGKVTVFTGRVKVNQEQSWLFTPYLQLRSEAGTAYARQGVYLVDYARSVSATAQQLDYKDDLTNVTMRQDVHINTLDDQGQVLRIRSDQLDWNNRAEIAVATGGVVVHYQDTTATAEMLTYHHRDRVLELSPGEQKGKVLPVVQQRHNQITGDLITLYVKDKTYEVTGSARAVILPQDRQETSQE
ncbi:LPS export ABC transporter periplasmic protein LptC [candidate division FCPU426 bacterium]|nr:LPS export ABC transporter periplasmic protein LptC [candidate division FCPU426 bacterium]